MWLIHTRTDKTISADSSVLPFYKELLQAGAQNKWLSYYETNVGKHHSGAVSYTHLDVYKRQNLCILKPMLV